MLKIGVEVIFMDRLELLIKEMRASIWEKYQKIDEFEEVIKYEI